MNWIETLNLPKVPWSVVGGEYRTDQELEKLEEEIKGLLKDRKVVAYWPASGPMTVWNEHLSVGRVEFYVVFEDGGGR